MRKLYLTLLILFFNTTLAYSVPHTIATYTIDPERNAFEHNNLGIVYMEEKFYAAAIEEFKMAISLNPKTQATAVYFNNLGRAYLKLGYPNLALDCFNNAIKQYSLNFEYYKNLANCYKNLNKLKEQINNYNSIKDKNCLNKIMLGLLHENAGNKKKAIIILDEFTSEEPELLITPAVKAHINKLVKELQNE